MTTPAGPHGPRPSVRRWAATGVAATVLLGGCSLPTAGEPEPEGDPSEAPIGSSTPDPSRDALVVEVGRTGATVAAARAELAGARDSEDVGGSRAAAEAALALLVADDGPGSDDEIRPLFPAESLDRDDVSAAPDQLTNTLTAARDVGGALGNAVVDLLRDPVAGDLGAWQRDAAGVLDSITATTREASDLEGLELAIAELPGLGTKAVAWAELTADATDLETAHAYADRAVASLDVITVSLEGLDLGGAPAAEPDGDAEAEGGS